MPANLFMELACSDCEWRCGACNIVDCPDLINQVTSNSYSVPDQRALGESFAYTTVACQTGRSIGQDPHTVCTVIAGDEVGPGDNDISDIENNTGHLVSNAPCCDVNNPGIAELKAIKGLVFLHLNVRSFAT